MGIQTFGRQYKPTFRLDRSRPRLCLPGKQSDQKTGKTLNREHSDPSTVSSLFYSLANTVDEVRKADEKFMQHIQEKDILPFEAKMSRRSCG